MRRFVELSIQHANAPGGMRLIQVRGPRGRPRIAAQESSPRPRSTGTAEKIQIALSLRSDGATLKEIGKALGVTREYARQLLKKCLSLEEIRQAKLAVRHAKHPPKPPRIKGQFPAIVKRWLLEHGYRWCCVCRQAKDSGEFSPAASNRRCKVCAAKQASNWYHANPERARAIAARMNSSPKGKEHQRRYRQKLKADPERYQQYVERHRELYKKRVETPEGRERVRAMWRMAHAKRRERQSTEASA